MKLAVMLPAYNAENFLTECLESLLNQTFSDFCILAVNDASTDNTGKVLETYAAKDARLRVYHLPQNEGEPAVMQFAMDMLNYINVEYIARMDADDICVPHRFERQVQYLDEHPEIDILGSNALFFNDGQTDKTTKISTLPLLDKDIKADAIFLGGTGKKLEEIIDWSKDLLVDGGRLVANFIIIDTFYEMLRLVKEKGFKNIDVTVLNVAKLEKLGTGEYFKPHNPIYIISCEKGVEEDNEY